MWYEILTVVFAGISAFASMVTAFAAFKAYTEYKKVIVKQTQNAEDNSEQIQIGNINEK